MGCIHSKKGVGQLPTNHEKDKKSTKLEHNNQKIKKGARRVHSFGSSSLTGRAIHLREENNMNELLVQLHDKRDIRSAYDGVDPLSGDQNTFQSSKNNQLDVNWLGRGKFGNVRVITRRDDQKKFACKILKIGECIPEHRRSELLAEIVMLAKLDHPNVAKLYETYEEEGANLYLVLELLKGGELYKRLTVDSKNGCFSEAEAQHTARQIVSAVAYLHSCNIVHRDLKLENFVYREKAGRDIVLIDFGLSVRYSRNVNKNPLTDLVGSSYYIAPEVIRKRYGAECDMWSIGVVVYMLLSGTPPFRGRTDSEILTSAYKGVYSLDSPLWYSISPNAKNFVKACLRKNISERITAKEALAHNWLHQTFPENIAELPHSKSLLGEKRTSAYGDSASETVPSGEFNSSRLPRSVSEGIIHNLCGYTRVTEFKRLALQAVAFSMSYDEIKELMDAFSVIDKDLDGYISCEELSEELQKHIGLSSEECQQVFKAVDFDRTGKIHLTEFVAAVLNENQYHDDLAIERAFEKLDLDHDGLIDILELKNMFHKHTPIGDAEYVAAVVDQQREQGMEEAIPNGKVSPRQFLAFMRQGILRRHSIGDSQNKKATNQIRRFESDKEGVTSPRLL